jgi:acetoin utilization deacetylase AcuC-like enzyme
LVLFLPVSIALLTQRPSLRYVMEGGYVVHELGNNVAAVLLGHEQATESQ